MKLSKQIKNIKPKKFKNKSNLEKNSKPIKKEKSWKKLKIQGNVISEEGFGLEGLIGLEVMESYDKNLISKPKKKNKQSRNEIPETLPNVGKGPKANNLSDDEGFNEPKTKKKKVKKQKLTKEPGQFVLLTKGKKIDGISDSEAKLKKQFPKKKKSKQPKKKSNTNTNVVAEPLKIEELVGWNGLGIPDVILKALAERGFKSPTQIQSLTIPSAIMGKKDILGAAETGSGKTLAFAIPILAGILDLKKRNISFGVRKQKLTQIKTDVHKTEEEDRDRTPPPEELNLSVDFPEPEGEIEESNEKDEKLKQKPLYCIILTPTRELAVQVKDHIVAAAKYTKIRVAAIFGGMAMVKQERVLRTCPEIVVATPGRLWELINQGNPHLNKMDNVSFLVIDETDRMIEKDHFEELKLLLKRLNTDESKKAARQNFVFSATLTLVHDIPEYLQKKNRVRKLKFVKDTPGLKIQKLIEELGISDPKVVDITRTEQTAQNLTESRILCPIDEKDYYLYYFLQRHPGRTIVFCNSLGCVKRLAQLFRLLNCNALPLHANMIQKQRLKNLERFRNNPNGLLIATDVAARGLDIPNIQHVIHYQVPRTSENYVHRSGRTARANKSGITVMFMEPKEVKFYLKLCKTLDREDDIPLFPVSERHMKGVKERVNLAREVDKMELGLNRISSQEGWLKKTADEMDIIIDNMNEFDSDDENELAMERSKQRQKLAVKKLALSSLLDQPLFPKGFSFKYPTLSGYFDHSKNEQCENQENDPEENSAVRAVQNSIIELKEMKNKRKRKAKGNITAGVIM